MEKFANCKNSRFAFVATVFHSGRLSVILGVFGLCVTLLSGCSMINVPKYIKDKSPYEKVLYGNFVDSRQAVTDVLLAMGWEIMEIADPAVYEHHRILAAPDLQQILLFTGVREGAWIFGTRYHRVNVYLREITPQTTNLEIRYLTVSSIPLRTSYSYRKDNVVNRIINAIEQSLATQLQKDETPS